jgi:hypothetical protein
MASKKENDDSPQKRIIEFDMFVPDLEPDQGDKIRGGGKSVDQQTPEDRKTEWTLIEQSSPSFERVGD